MVLAAWREMGVAVVDGRGKKRIHKDNALAGVGAARPSPSHPSGVRGRAQQPQVKIGQSRSAWASAAFFSASSGVSLIAGPLKKSTSLLL